MDFNKICPNCFCEKNEPICPNCGFHQVDAERAPIALPQGTILNGRYWLGKILGIGGFGVTYLGFDLTLEIRVAIKEYLPVSLATRNSDRYTMTVISAKDEAAFNTGAERFLNEARILAKLKDTPHIVAVQNYFKENNTAYFVMEYVDGQSLKEFLKQRGGSIPWQQALSILLPVMTALRDVHALNLLHRDISPDNIYISSGGQSMLLDFGAARFTLGSDKSISVILKHGYAPEEQYRTHGNQGPWTDVYAMGATFYNCITGTLPPDAIDRLHEDHLIPPSQLGISLPPAAEQALLQAMAVHAEKRFGSMAELIHALTGQSIRASGVATAAAVYASPLADSRTGIRQPSAASASSASMIIDHAADGAISTPIPADMNSGLRMIFSKHHLPWLIAGAVTLILAIVLPIIFLTGSNSSGGTGDNFGGAKINLVPGQNQGSLPDLTQPAEHSAPPGESASLPEEQPVLPEQSTANPEGSKNSPKESSSDHTDPGQPDKPDGSMTAFESKGLGIKAQIPADMTVMSNNSLLYLKRDNFTEIAAYFTYSSGAPAYTLNDFMAYQDQIVQNELNSLQLPQGWTIAGSSGIDLGGLNARAVAINGGRSSHDQTELYAAELKNAYGCYIIVILQSSRDPDLVKHQAENKAFIASLQFSGEPTGTQGLLDYAPAKIHAAYAKELCSAVEDDTSAGGYLHVSLKVPGAGPDEIINLSSPGKFYSDTDGVIDSFVSGYTGTQAVSGQTDLKTMTFGAHEYSIKELEFTNQSGVLIHAICAVTWIDSQPYKLECAYSPANEQAVLEQFTILLTSLSSYPAIQ